jgi:polyferredoxin
MERPKFVKGLVFAVLALILLLLWIAQAFNAISTAKTTGLAAVPGGLPNGLATIGLFAIILVILGVVVVRVMRSRTIR